MKFFSVHKNPGLFVLFATATLATGDSVTAITEQQLAQISFINPSALPEGAYPARLLPTGELVPDSGGSLPLNVILESNDDPSVPRLCVHGKIGRTCAI